MNIKRRDFIKVASALSVSAGFASFTLTNAGIDDGPEVEEFKKAQQKLLDKYAVSARSSYLKLTKPTFTAHLLEAGQGDPVLMLHGGGSFACQFAPLMASLQNDFHLFVPDRPGCGLSDRVNYVGVPFREHTVDFISGILDSLKLPKVSLIGNSMGGYWALVYSLAHPERVSKLVLIGEPAGSSPPEKQRIPPPANKNPSLEFIHNNYKFLLVANVDRVAPEILEATLAAAKLPGADIAWNTMIEQFKQNKELGTYALRTELKNLQTETLFIWGEQDKLGSPELGQEMALIAPNARCETVQDAGHLVWLDQLERCALLTSAFLKKKDK